MGPGPRRPRQNSCLDIFCAAETAPFSRPRHSALVVEHTPTSTSRRGCRRRSPSCFPTRSRSRSSVRFRWGGRSHLRMFWPTWRRPPFIPTNSPTGWKPSFASGAQGRDKRSERKPSSLVIAGHPIPWALSAECPRYRPLRNAQAAWRYKSCAARCHAFKSYGRFQQNHFQRGLIILCT